MLIDNQLGNGSMAQWLESVLSRHAGSLEPTGCQQPLVNCTINAFSHCLIQSFIVAKAVIHARQFADTQEL